MRLYNETHYDIRLLQQRILRNLEVIHQVCRDHHLRYYLVAGTMLGAVRHQGFIPWDDDIDIAMPRPDYERLIAHAREWLPQPYELLCTEHADYYPYPFGKLIDASTTVLERPDFKYLEGVYIDIFPLDGAPSTTKEQHRHYRRYKFWRHLLFMRGRDPFKHGHGPRSWFPWLLHRVFSLRYLQQRVKQLMTKYDYDTSSYVEDYDFGLRGFMKKEVYGTPQPCTFEQHTFCGVSQPDTYLAHLYGDYMQLPPKEQQIQHHFFRLDLKQPYHETTLEAVINQTTLS